MNAVDDQDIYIWAVYIWLGVAAGDLLMKKASRSLTTCKFDMIKVKTSYPLNQSYQRM